MNYAKIYVQDFCNGPGIGVSLFVQGCARAHSGNPCPGCFNPSTWNPAGGKPYTNKTRDRILELMEPDYISHLALLGGEPMDNQNIAYLADLCFHTKRLFPQKKIWVWTGFTFEQLQDKYDMEHYDSLFANFIQTVDYLVDGPFIDTQKDLSLRFRGSRNQRILDCRESVRQGMAVLSEYN